MKLKLFLLFLFLSFGGVIYTINHTNHTYYSQLLEEKTEKIVYGSSAPRGRILDQNGNVLVDNVGIIEIAYHKPVNSTIKSEIEIATLLEPFVKEYNLTLTNLKNYYLAIHNNGKDLITKEEWKLWEERKLSNEDISDLKWNRITEEMLVFEEKEKRIIYLFSLMNDGYYYEDKILLSDVTEEELAKIMALNISSIKSVISSKRVYPYGETLKSILGTIGNIPKENVTDFLNNGYSLDDVVGTSGIEEEYESILKGKKAKYYINSDNTLTLLEEAKIGTDVVLNIDINIQLELERILKEEMILASKKSTSKFFKEAYAMVGNPKTGGVLALAGLKLKDDGKIHTIFKQNFARTGRLSSTEPNLQNIPVRDEEGKRIREAFFPSNDEFLSADYSQIELRILAHISGSKELQEAFIHDQDIHTKVAADIHGIKESEVTKKMRSTAKAVIFGIVYGISGFGLGENLEISAKEAKNFIDKYYELYPGVKRYMERIVEEAYEQGSVRTLFNRRRTIPELNSPEYMVRQAGERIALNTPIQGTSADIIKKAMVEIYEKFAALNIKSKMVLQVHDELIFDVVKEEQEKVEKIVKEILTHTITLDVPLKVSADYGKNWYDTK